MPSSSQSKLSYSEASRRGLGQEWLEITGLRTDRMFWGVGALAFTGMEVGLWLAPDAAGLELWAWRVGVAVVALVAWLIALACHLELRSLK